MCMKIFLISYLFICLLVCTCRRVMALLLGLGFCLSWYLVFLAHRPGFGLILFAVLCFTTVLYRVAGGEQLPDARQGRKGKGKTPPKTTALGRLHYLVPIFWPVIILRLLAGTKERPADMTPYDYEQHQKCNGR